MRNNYTEIISNSDKFNSNITEVKDEPIEVSSSKQNGDILIAVVILILLIIAGGSYFYLSLGKPENQISPTVTQPANSSVTPTSIPTSATTMVSPTVRPSEVPPQKKYTHEYLPGFEMTYDDSQWDLHTKTFKTNQALYKTKCDEDCMEVVLTKGEISLEIVFLVAYEDIGYLRCSNSAEFHNIGNNWYRIKNKSGYFYSYGVNSKHTLGVQEDHVATEGECQQSTDSLINIPQEYGAEWSCTANTRYEICDSGHGVFLALHSSVDSGLDGTGVPIIMEKPKIIGTPNKELLAEIDEIVSSIKFE